MTEVPFAIGEEFESKWQALPYIERGLANFMRIDICNVGGFTEAMKVAAWCEAHYIDVMPHNPVGPLCTAASVHFLAALPNCAWLEVRTPPRGPSREDNSDAAPERRAIYPKQVELDGTWYPLPTDPGLGIEVDEDSRREPGASPLELDAAPPPRRLVHELLARVRRRLRAPRLSASRRLRCGELPARRTSE